MDDADTDDGYEFLARQLANDNLYMSRETYASLVTPDFIGPVLLPMEQRIVCRVVERDAAREAAWREFLENAGR